MTVLIEIDDLVSTQSTKNVPIQAPGRSRLALWFSRFVSMILFAALIGGIAYSYDAWKPRLDAWIRPSVADRPKPRPPLVTLAAAKTESIPQYINCLGTVTAFNVVSVQSRVDGELVEVVFEEGQLVEEGQLLARIDPRAFETSKSQVQAQLDRDQANLDLAKATLKRIRQNSTSGVYSQLEIDENAMMVRQGEASVAMNRAALSNTDLLLSYTQILAPIRGRVGLRLVDRGNMVKANGTTAIVVITQLQPISLVFTIPQDDIPRVQSRLAEAGSVKVLAFDRSFQHLIETGTLTAVDNQVDASTGTLKLKARFENEGGKLFPNQFVNVRLLVKEWDNAIVIPASAIQYGPDFSYVYVANIAGEDSTVDVRKVVVNFAHEGRTVIESGLVEGEQVVIEGTDKLQPGGKVSLPGSKPGKPGAKAGGESDKKPDAKPKQEKG